MLGYPVYMSSELEMNPGHGSRRRQLVLITILYRKLYIINANNYYTFDYIT